MTDADKTKIIDLKEKIHDYTEYLHSEICSNCGIIALELEKYIQELSDILQRYDPNS